jgi:hypothetical protein
VSQFVTDEGPDGARVGGSVRRAIEHIRLKKADRQYDGILADVAIRSSISRF